MSSIPEDHLCERPTCCIPPRPTWEMLPPALIPHPPLLTPDAPDDEKVRLLLMAYRGAIESRYQKRCFAFTRGPVPAKVRRALLECAAHMVDEEVAPAAWAAWSTDLWKHYSEKKPGRKQPPPPPVTWVFKASRLVDRLGWFRHEEVSVCSGGRAIITPARKDLMWRYGGLAHSIDREFFAGTLTASRAREIMERYFPGGLYDELLARAREEADEERSAIRRLLVRGEFLW